MAPLVAGSSLLLLFLVQSVLIAAQPLDTRATIFNSTANLKDRYDYIVVGGGTSGLTVANRLTEDASGTRRRNTLLPIWELTGVSTHSFRTCD